MVQVMVCNSLSGFEVGNIFLILIVNNFSTFSELMIFHSIWQNIYMYKYVHTYIHYIQFSLEKFDTELAIQVKLL